jgi:uncharacterized protein
MKSSETDILIVPAQGGAGGAHWQSRIAAKLTTARIVEQPDAQKRSLGEAVGALARAVADASRPVVFVAHSTGASLVVQSMPSLVRLGLIERVRGAYLVVPPSIRALTEWSFLDPAFAALPRDPLPFPSLLIASSNDPHSTLEESADLALAWGAQLVEAGDAGHINEASGHGPWPEGLMRFAGFLSKLS